MKWFALFLATLLPVSAASPTGAKGQGVGNPAAPVMIELYSDFGCPGCREFHAQTLPQLMRDYVNTGKVYLVNHDMSSHLHSNEATGYAFAAARIGKYSQVCDVLFQHQAEWSVNGKVWDAVAAVLTPAEQKKVAALAKDPAVLAEVKNETDVGRTKVQRTPTLLVTRGMKQYHFEGAQDWYLFSGFLNDILK